MGGEGVSMGKLLKTFVIIAILVSRIAIGEGTEKHINGQFAYLINEDNTITIIDYLRDESSVVDIPSEIEGRRVTGIGNKAFWNCKNLTSITVPDSVAYIQDEAFGYCTSLESVWIADGVTRLGDLVFLACSDLRSIKIPESVIEVGRNPFAGSGVESFILTPDHPTLATSDDVLFEKTSKTLISCSKNKTGEYIIPYGISDIGDYAFAYCGELISVVIPDSVNCIGDSAFIYANKLKSVDLPNSVNTMGKYSFYGCRSLTSIDISRNIKELEDSVFGLCGNITNITIPRGVTAIGREAFFGCINLASIDIPDGISTIGDGAFYGCVSLKSISLPDSVLLIGNMVFYQCSSLQRISLPPNVNSIGDGTFGECNNLISVGIPDGVTSIDKWAFWNCPDNLVLVVGRDSYAKQYAEEYSWAYTHLDGLAENSKLLTYGDYNYAVKADGTAVIVKYDPSVKGKLVIPEELDGRKISEIGDYAFALCRTHESVVIPDCIEKVGLNPFARSNIISFYVSPEHPTLAVIDGVLFDKVNKALIAFPSDWSGSYAIPQGIKQINDSSFNGCVELSAISIPDSVLSIGDGAFFGCINLTSVDIPQGVSFIGNNAFKSCKGLEKVILPDSVDFIGKTAFLNCSEELLVTVGRTSYAKQYMKENGIAYTYIDVLDWLKN